MAAVYVVRHAQAQYGTDDYDRLSELGARQCELLAARLKDRGVRPNRIVCGTMRRHRQTATLVSRAAGWTAEIADDDGWDEYDHDDVLRAGLRGEGRSDADVDGTGRARQPEHAPALERAIDRWIDDQLPSANESFPRFRNRIMTAFSKLTATLGPGDQAVVFTSGGPMAIVAADLLAREPLVWRKLDRATVTTGVTVVGIGRSGSTLVSFNEHGHLPPSLRVYR